MYEKNKCTLSKKELHALLAFASKDECRPHICGVAFNPKEGHVASTDGYSLLRVEGPKGEGPDFMLSRGTLVRLTRMLGTHDALVVTSPKLTKTKALPKYVEVEVVERGHTFYVLRSVLKGKVERLDASPPPFDAVIPAQLIKDATEHAASRGEGTEEVKVAWRVGLRGVFLSRLRVLEKAADREGVECYMGPSDLDPATFIARAAGGLVLRAVIMPMRI
jgi:hypothetical protein